jgi:hypothetical protein
MEGIDKLPPFGAEEGQPWGRINWNERLEGGDQQVSPAIAVQVGQKAALSSGTESSGSESRDQATGEE